MNIGMVPVTGIPLPFLSYGGSSLLVSFIGLGIVANIAYHKEYLSIEKKHLTSVFSNQEMSPK